MSLKKPANCIKLLLQFSFLICTPFLQENKHFHLNQSQEVQVGRDVRVKRLDNGINKDKAVAGTHALNSTGLKKRKWRLFSPFVAAVNGTL